MTIQAIFGCYAIKGSESGLQRHKLIVSTERKISGNSKGMCEKSASETSPVKYFLDPSHGIKDKYVFFYHCPEIHLHRCSCISILRSILVFLWCLWVTEALSISRCTWTGACPPSNHPGKEDYVNILTSTVTNY